MLSNLGKIIFGLVLTPIVLIGVIAGIVYISLYSGFMHGDALVAKITTSK